jgi:DNA-binding MarR family transcriptional regulator
VALLGNGSFLKLRCTSAGIVLVCSVLRHDLTSNGLDYLSNSQYLIPMKTTLTSRDYRSLAELRHQIRLFAHFSEQAVRSAGLNPSQHQLMLALKGLPPHLRPSIGELAKRLQIRHHSTVELVNRLARRGYVRRQRGHKDRREVLLSLTVKGDKLLSELSLHHRAELRKAGPALIAALHSVMRGTRTLGY